MILAGLGGQTVTSPNLNIGRPNKRVPPLPIPHAHTLNNMPGFPELQQAGAVTGAHTSSKDLPGRDTTLAGVFQ